MTVSVPVFGLQDRLNLALRQTDLSKAEMAAYIGVSVGTLSTWVNGKHRPSTAALKLWAQRCNVSFDWLAGTAYIGERQIRTPSNSTSAVA